MPQLNETLEAKGDDPLEEDAVSRIHEETEAHLQAYLAGAPSLGVGGKGGGGGKEQESKVGPRQRASGSGIYRVV